MSALYEVLHNYVKNKKGREWWRAASDEKCPVCQGKYIPQCHFMLCRGLFS